VEPFLIIGQDPKSHYIYGADNATQKFQEALDQFSTTGGWLHCKEGPLPAEIYSSLMIDSHVKVTFSPGLLIKYGNGSNYNAIFKNRTVGATDITLEGLRIDGNREGDNPTPSVPRDMVRFLNTTDCTIRNIRVRNFPDSAVVFDGASGSHNVLEDFVIEDGDDIGVYMSNTSSNTIRHGVVRRMVSYGVRNRRTTGGGLLSEIINVRTEECGINPDPALNVAGMMVDSTELTKVALCTSVGSGGNNYHVKAAYCLMNNNHSFNAGAHGFYINGAARGTLNGNVNHNASRLAPDTYSGIFLENVTDLGVNGNRSGDSGSGATRQAYGLEEVGSSNNNRGTGNIFDRNGLGAVKLVGANSSIT